MPSYVSFNHQILPNEKVFLSADSSAALYGKGIFTTAAIHNSKPFLWEKHWQRLIEHSQTIGVNLAKFKEESVHHSLLELIGINNFTSGRARLTFFDDSSNLWRNGSNTETNLLIQLADLRSGKNKLSLTVSPFSVNSTSPLAGVKSCNYLENILALENAKERNFDEAIRLNERGEIVSACLANIFWKKNGRIFTPHLETGCMKGTTRSFVLEKFQVKEVRADLAEIEKADEVFLTSAGIGIAEVLRFEMS